MLDTIVGIVKGFLSGKGGTQIGSGNRNQSGITTSDTQGSQFFGDNNQQIVINQSATGFAVEQMPGLERIMPEVFAWLRKGLSKDPNVRRLAIHEKGLTYSGSKPFIRFIDADFPAIESKLHALAQSGAIHDISKGQTPYYMMSEHFAHYLKSQEQNPAVTFPCSPEAAILLVQASKKDGLIVVMLHSEGLAVQAGSLQKTIPHDKQRDQTVWQSAAKELWEHDFVEQHGSDEMFMVTLKGHKQVDSFPADFIDAVLKAS